MTRDDAVGNFYASADFLLTGKIPEAMTCLQEMAGSLIVDLEAAINIVCDDLGIRLKTEPINVLANALQRGHPMMTIAAIGQIVHLAARDTSGPSEGSFMHRLINRRVAMAVAKRDNVTYVQALREVTVTPAKWQAEAVRLALQPDDYADWEMFRRVAPLHKNREKLRQLIVALTADIIFQGK